MKDEVNLSIEYEPGSGAHSKSVSFTATVRRNSPPICSFPLFVALAIIVWFFTGIFLQQWQMSNPMRLGMRLGAITIGLHFYFSSSVHVTEQLLLMEDMGVQLTSKESRIQVLQLGRKVESTSKEFIPWNRVRNMVINEGFKSFGVIHYLTILVEGDEIKVVFPKILPRLPQLTEVWRAGSSCFNER